MATDTAEPTVETAGSTYTEWLQVAALYRRRAAGAVDPAHATQWCQAAEVALSCAHRVLKCD